MSRWVLISDTGEECPVTRSTRVAHVRAPQGSNSTLRTWVLLRNDCSFCASNITIPHLTFHISFCYAVASRCGLCDKLKHFPPHVSSEPNNFAAFISHIQFVYRVTGTCTLGDVTAADSRFPAEGPHGMDPPAVLRRHLGDSCDASNVAHRMAVPPATRMTPDGRRKRHEATQRPTLPSGPK